MRIKDVYTNLAAEIQAAEILVGDTALTATAFAPDALVVPHFFGAEFIGQYHKSYGGLLNIQMTWRLMVSRGDDRSGQEAAWDLASSTGDGTLLDAIEGARGAPGQKALSGAADDIVLQRVSGPRLFVFGTTEYYGLEFGLYVTG